MNNSIKQYLFAVASLNRNGNDNNLYYLISFLTFKKTYFINIIFENRGMSLAVDRAVWRIDEEILSNKENSNRAL